MATETSQQRLAVLIDADNAASAIAEGLLAEIAKYGVASVKRIYGDWTDQHLKGWRDKLLEHAIQPIQQFAYTKGKNATDSAMMIDAMDLLYTDKFQGFCLVSSDSDFTRLASRIRESGLVVYGFGEKKTPKSFVGACDKFTYTEILRSDAGSGTVAPAKPKNAGPALKRNTRLLALLRSAAEESADDSGWAYLGNIGKYIANARPDFDPRNYGFSKLGDLIRAADIFEIDERTVDNAPGKLIYARPLKKKRR